MKLSAQKLVKFSYRKFGRVIVASAFIAALLGASGCGKQGPQAAPPALPPALVTVARAVAQDVPVYLDEIGKNYASESVTITPQISGKIIERTFTDGADLKKGQVLFNIDPRPFQAQLDLAQAQLAQSKSALDLADLQLKIYASVSDPRAVSQIDYETKKNAVESNKAQVQAAEAAVEAAKLNLDYCIIRSPIDGRAGVRLVDTGNIVQANTTPMLSIVRLDPIYADFTVTERDLPDVRRQMNRGESKAMVRIPADAENAARAGKLTFLDNTVQSGTGTVFMRATLPNADRHFWPGQFVDVKLVLTTNKGAVLIPSEATQISQKGPFVYVVKPDNTVELRQVTLGQKQGDKVVIASGVATGESVVVTGQLTIGPGAKVRVEGGAPGGAPGAAQGGRQ